MSEFPTSTPTDRNTTPTETLDDAAGGFGHSALHNFEVDELIAIATKVGTGASTPTAGLLLRGTGAGTSAWGQVDLAGDVGAFTSAQLAARLTDETGSGAAVFASSPSLSGGSWAGSPTLTTPTIADFSNATHTHANNAGGGVLGTSALSNASVTPNKLATGAAVAYVATGETTASTSYVDLATTTDSVTVTIGANGILVVTVGCLLQNSGANFSSMSFALSGANTQSADDPFSISIASTARLSATFMLSGLAAGSTTVKAKYSVSAGTGTFTSRRISAVPL